MLDYAEQNADSLFPLEYRSYLGQAAHAVLQYCAERRTETEADIRKTAEEVGNLLIREGREFRGRKEPPLPAEDVWLGVEVAVAYLLARGLPLDADTIIPEQEWNHPHLPYRALIDLVTVQDEGDEEYTVRVVDVCDYKSSWQAGPDELHTLQRWGQAICVWRALNDPNKPHGLDSIDILRQRVVNLRTWQEYTRDIHLGDPDAVAELEKWEKRIGKLCETATESVNYVESTPGVVTEQKRQANPGAGCLFCAYRHICEDAYPHFLDADDDIDSLAHNLAIVEGQRSMLLKALKTADNEGPIQIQGGWIGFKAQPTRVMLPGSERHLVADWFEHLASKLPDEMAPTISSMLSALKLTKGNLDAFAKALFPERKKDIGEVRAEYVEGYTQEKRRIKFGVWKDEQQKTD